MTFINSKGFFLTPFDYSIPKDVRYKIFKIGQKEANKNKSHDIYVKNRNGMTEFYKIVLKNIGSGITQCNVFHVITHCLDSPYHVTVPGSIYFLTYDNIRKSLVADVELDKDLNPSVSFNMVIDRHPCHLTIRPGSDKQIAFGRQSMEIGRFMGIHYEIFKNGVTSKPNFSKYVEILRESYQRLNYSAIGVYIVQNNETVPVCLFSQDWLRPELDILISKLDKSQVINGVTARTSLSQVRITMHTIVVEETTYLMVFAADISSSILRSIIELIQTITSLITIHHHTQICTRELSTDFTHISHVVDTSKKLCIFETIDDELIWSQGYLYDRKFNKEMFNAIKTRTFEALQMKVGECKSIVVPMWESSNDRRFINICARKSYSNIHNCEVVTFIALDVSNEYNSGIFDNFKLMNGIIFGVLHDMSRVRGDDFTIETSPPIKRYLGEIPSSDFSVITNLTESKQLNSFIERKQSEVRIIKSNGLPFIVETVPLGNNGDFAFYPAKPLMKAIPQFLNMFFSVQNEKISRKIRLSFFDISRDEFLDIEMLSYPAPDVEWESPEELNDSPSIRKHILNISGTFYGHKCITFLQCVNDCFKFGKSSSVVYVHDDSSVKPFLVQCQYSHGILTIVLFSIEEENNVLVHAMQVMNVLDGVNCTGHIFMYRFVPHITADGIFVSPPSGMYPILFSESSFRHIYMPHQANILSQQIQTGRVEMALLLKYDIPRWYIDIGVCIGEEFKGMCFRVPPNAISEGKLNRSKVLKSANNLINSFYHLNEAISDCDISEALECLNEIKKFSGK
ncbi:hypothetical protein TVAG_273460 [Trichomonas vaginalis G3]|uniref:Uncharacterized protein n=1 Tax=Trichomonas vaginalis (strain ATCC PRA-98 / G3) TaxID=412133 RepID=A2EI23_TRIV3|nr:hypothetical protein TVAGG3_0747220 [Trichomonas vaginalis G3]EAY07662.1 hypothetical protein TVAG_273460 [Trichomonas vaginalis G3]KAI5512259.1 hypothetical protein TVAGG3_0747220 [Trichomonas vaginalis G3]|eukprot:XP_001319885.1 hypothetical protein [Trichomonas vaginalis G3]